jgi:hypothetical protein
MADSISNYWTQFQHDNLHKYCHFFSKWGYGLQQYEKRRFVLSIEIEIQVINTIEIIKGNIMFSSDKIVRRDEDKDPHVSWINCLVTNNRENAKTKIETFFEEILSSTTDAEDESDYYNIQNILQDPEAILKNCNNDGPHPTRVIEAWQKFIDLISPSTSEGGYVLK